MYKRQVYNLTKLPETVGLSEAATAKATELMGTDPVSYTHLDVYKRQVVQFQFCQLYTVF